MQRKQIIEQAGVQPWNFCLGSWSRMLTTRRDLLSATEELRIYLIDLFRDVK
ncbi:hypothetical protein [Porphyromonas phage phage019b_ATCC49417]|uniref:Uncharacterized protein n=1 Tax=Porphyromonas phage phage019a_ATCC49417 TaxID=3154109 RepID=A0AAT9J8I1_9VIRU